MRMKKRPHMKDFTNKIDRLYLLTYLAFAYKAQFQALF